MRLIEHGIYDADITRYTLDPWYPRPDFSENDRENKNHWTTCRHNAQELILDKNYYTNLKSLHLCFPIGFRRLTNSAQDLDANPVPVNNFFVHWIKRIDITKYGANKNLFPTTTQQNVYRYSDAILKHLPKNVLKWFKTTFCFA